MQLDTRNSAKKKGWICICLWLAQLSTTKRPQRIGGVLVKSADWCAISIEYIYINYIRNCPISIMFGI